jgi:hypothetical protein
MLPDAPPTREVVKPDMVTTKGSPTACPVCGSLPEDAPEGLHDFVSANNAGAEPGSPKWTFPHCWKCGYRS